MDSISKNCPQLNIQQEQHLLTSYLTSRLPQQLYFAQHIVDQKTYPYTQYLSYAFANGHVNYQLITTFELYLIKVAPPEVREFIFKFLFWENKKQKESSLCGEGLDYRLEEYNKKFKVYLHVLFPTFEDWVTVCSNTPVLDKMDGAQKKTITLVVHLERSGFLTTAPGSNIVEPKLGLFNNQPLKKALAY